MSNQKLLGTTLWNIADQLRGAMNADDFRDYMLSFHFRFGTPTTLIVLVLLSLYAEPPRVPAIYS